MSNANNARRTDTPGVFVRCNRYLVQWTEDGKTKRLSFPTYEEACAFRRDYVIPFRERRGLPPTSIMPPRRNLGWVYFFQSGGPRGPVKVGWSKDPATRLRDLSVAHPHGLDLVALFPGPRSLEAELHERWKHRRLRREWFSCEVLKDLIVWIGGELEQDGDQEIEERLEPVLAKAIMADARGVPDAFVRLGVRSVLHAARTSDPPLDDEEAA